MSGVGKTAKCLTVVVVSLQVLKDVNTSTSHFKVDAELEEAFVLTHQLSQTHLRLYTKHLRPLSDKHYDSGGHTSSSAFAYMWNNSPAVARVSRPYSWCTLATCVHNCPSMIFRTRCCLRPKCKRSYLLIYITSGSYINKLNV